MQETRIQSLDQEDLLEKEMATHSSILPGKSHRWKSLVIYNSWGHKELDTTEAMVNTEIRLIIFFAAKDGEALYSQQKQHWELTVAQIMNSLLTNSDLN